MELETDLFSMNFFTIEAKFCSVLTLLVELSLTIELVLGASFLRNDLGFEEVDLNSVDDDGEVWESNEL